MADVKLNSSSSVAAILALAWPRPWGQKLNHRLRLVAVCGYLGPGIESLHHEYEICRD